MFTIINTLLPIFSLVLLGLLAERFRLVPKGGAVSLNQFVFNLGMPSLIFASIATKDVASLNQIAFMVGTIGGMFACYLVFYAIFSRGFRTRHLESGVLSLLASCPNNVFLGLPILVALFPGNDNAVLACTLSGVVGLPLMLLAMLELEIMRNATQHTRFTLMLKVGQAMLTNPLLLAAVAGVGACVLRVPVPDAVMFVFRTLGATTTPCALVALGMVLATQLACRASGSNNIVHQASIHTFKLVVEPLFTWVILDALGVEGAWLAMGVILAAMPTATMAYVLSENYEACTRQASQAIIVNTAVSIVTIPLLVMALQHFHFM